MKCYICQCEVHIPVMIKCFPCFKSNVVHCNTYTRFCYECMVRFLQLNQSSYSRIESLKCLTCSETIHPKTLNYSNSFEYDFLLHQMKIASKHKCPFCFLDVENVFTHLDSCGSNFIQCVCGYVTIKDLFDYHIFACPQYKNCHFCDKFIGVEDFNEHLESLHQLTNCNKCNETINVENKSVHEKFLCKFRLIRCRFCKKTFEFNNLNEHLEAHKEQTVEMIDNMKTLLRELYERYYAISKEQTIYFERFFLTE